MHIGFILTKTPAEEGFRTFLEFALTYLGREEISIYLLGNGVFCARKGHLNEEKIKKILEKSKIYANSDDLKARGIKKEDIIDEIVPIYNYDVLVVDVMEKFDQILSF